MLEIIDFLENREYYVEAEKLRQGETSLDFFARYIGDEEVGEIAELLKINTTITSFSIMHTSGGTELAESLKTNKTLTTFRIMRSEMGDEGAKEFAHALKINNTLTSLDLHNNNMSTFNIFADVLKINNSLTHFIISSINPKCEGLGEFADALKINNSLTYFCFSGCGQMKETDRLAAALKINKTLTSLVLLHVVIEDVEVENLANCLQLNKTLTCFNFSSRNISNIGVKKLVDALKNNYTLTHFVVKNNGRDDEGILDEIEERINHNKSLVQKLSLSISDYFNNKTEDNAFKVLACTKFYQKADKELLKEYLTKQNIIDVKSTLNEVNNLITEKAFTVLSICKNIQTANFKAAVGKTHISDLPNEVMKHIGSYLIHNLWEKNVEVIGNIVEEIN
ncbi:hypothetical protein [Rickettsia endosymbiont of Polydrusus tereticollis]|uniref:hypothetical protein n=1 Tax=Rickettsia endosymbiont of Polydrusus tereticollis TaxID=3066251 RepID=UPI0031334CA9